MKKFSSDEISDIKKRLDDGENIFSVAKKFNTSAKRIEKVISNLVDTSEEEDSSDHLVELETENMQLKQENERLKTENKMLLERVTFLENDKTVRREPTPPAKEESSVPSTPPPPDKTIDQLIVENPNDPFFKILQESKQKESFARETKNCC
jgi:transposase-like protein